MNKYDRNFLTLLLFTIGMPFVAIVGSWLYYQPAEHTTSEDGAVIRDSCEDFCEAAGSYLVAIDYDLGAENARCVCSLPDQE